MTSAAITMTAPEAASPVQMYRATYSPDDNKLRLYAVSRLDPETYKKVHDAGFRWAPKQALFVAPAWTPGREDVLLSLAGEIEDEDSTLAERQEARAERFTGYSGKRASESAQALDEVERLAAMIPPGQPILVGHHSERRARRDAQRIENGMKRAVMLFERAEYWEERARSALLHAKYKERPDVRWRRIKKIEADLRKAEKTIAQSQKYLTMWRAESLDLNMAKLISSHDHISACFPLDTYPRPAEKSQYEGSRSLWSALDDDIITTEQAREIAIRCHERQIQHQQRWVNHYQNRLIYERAMLDESGGVVTRTQDFEPGGQVFSRGEWLTIIRVNKSNGAVSSVTTPNYSFLGYRALYESGRITEAACMAHARRKIHDVHARAPTYITTEALQRIGELYAIEAEVRGCSAEQRLAARKARAAPLMQSLYDWIQQQMKTLSRHSDTAKAFAYLLKQWDALNVYCSNGWVEIDNNIAENALRGVAVGRKNWMFAGSDSGGEHAAVLYSLIGTCRLNNVEPEKWLRYVIEHIQDWPANRVRDLLPWKVDLSSQ